MRSRPASDSSPLAIPLPIPERAGRTTRKQKALPRNPSTSIAVKWSLTIATLIAVGMGLLGWVLIEQQRQIHLREMKLFGQTVAVQFAHSTSGLLKGADKGGLKALARHLLEGHQILGMGIYDTDHRPLLQAGLPLFPGKVTRRQLQSEQPIEWTWRETQGRPRHAISFTSPIEFESEVEGYALVTLDRDILDQELRGSVHAIALATLGFMTITMLISFLLGRRLLRPLKHLAEAGEAIEKGEFNFRIPDRRKDEIGQIIHAFNRMAAGMLEKKQVEAALSRYVSPQVAENILTNLHQVSLGGIHVDGSVLFCDIAGYTELSEDLPPDQVGHLLNEYFGLITLAGQSCQGTVDKFIGDCVMVVFGVPEKDEHHALHAISGAVLIQQIVNRLNEARRRRHQPWVRFRIGISSGQMLAGNMGAAHHMQYTVVGDTVNLAARLCPLAVEGKIIVSQKTADQPSVQEYVVLREHLPMRVRGRRKPVTPYTVVSLDERLQRCLDEMLDSILPVK